MEEKNYAELEVRFNQNQRIFICTEALKIFSSTQSEEIALRVLELLKEMAQPY